MSSENTISMTIPSRIEELTHIEELSVRLAKQLSLDQDKQNNLSIAITEAVGNAITHGNGRDPEKTVDILVKITPTTLTVSVSDQGSGFDPSSISDPLAPENMLKESGRGIFILRQLMDDVTFKFEKGTTLSFMMRLDK
ncbi:ATP-binding protein [bacterium]|nr:ATP-binding protein [bacterium]